MPIVKFMFRGTNMKYKYVTLFQVCFFVSVMSNNQFKSMTGIIDLIFSL